ncbi:MAG: TonB-dependent receptor [Gammaproteobacteria bacterium]|nr:TonB-dependent receptor [Gammaproteobacteria bacterium]
MNPGIIIISLITLLTLFSGSSAHAQDISEEDELNQFLNLLQQQTMLATKTRLNADFVPGMLSVLNAEQLQRRGFRTVWEALASLPGVNTSMDETGMRSISVRGIGELFEPSKVKLLLNGVSVNASASATTGSLFDTPVAQIERIEFIRGPGSAVHGEFAYAGLLNVITRKTGKEFSVGLESDSGVSFSALYNYRKPGSDFSSSFNLAANESDGEKIDSGRDSTLGGNSSYAPGPINNKRDFVSAIIDLNFGDLNTLIQLQQSNRGDHFGTNNLLPPDEKQTVISENLLSAKIGQPFSIDGQLGGEWSFSGSQISSEKNQLFLGVAEAHGGLGNEDDIYADSDLTEQRFEARVNLQYDSDRHKLFAELSAVDISISESEQFINLDPTTKLPSPTFNEFPGPVDDSQARSSLSIVLQDEYRIDERLTLTTGMRYDDYEDIASNLSPRIALVWRRSDNHVFKTQLARAFRPPSLIETGGSIESSIDAETNDTLELGYIYYSPELVLRNTLYYTQLYDLIVFQDFAPFGYRNSGSFDLWGYELEVEKSISNKWNLVGSLSLQDYIDDNLPGFAPWMLKLGTEYRIMPLTSLHLQINAVSRRERASGDPRSDFKQSTRADLMLRRQNLLGVDGLGLRLGLRNLFDETLEHPSPEDSYPGDYPYSDGTMLWAQIIYQP